MPSVLNLAAGRMPTPIGELILVTDREGKLRAADWTDYQERMLRLLKLHYGENGYALVPDAAPAALRDTMERYFAGEIRSIDDIEVETAGTSFQRGVWKALRAIPPGSPVSYGVLAEQIGRPKAVRAVGLANGSNPVGIVVPCHRVIGANGSLTGYGGGLERKRWLLDHEQRHGSGR